MDSVSLLNSFAAAFLVAGAGLVAMVPAARRYCTNGPAAFSLCMLMFQAGLSALSFTIFWAYMLATWLVTSAEPPGCGGLSVILTVGQILIWFGTTLLAQTLRRKSPQLTAVAINSLLS